VSSPFKGIKVLEYAGFAAGPYCGKLLADLGADVIKIEPPGTGDPARNFGPFPENNPHPEKSGLFLHLSLNKRSITLDPSTPMGKELFLKLAAIADVLIEDSTPGQMEVLGLSFPQLHEINPALVYVSVTPYGQFGPQSKWKAHHINTFHASGEGYTLPGGATHSRFPDRPPVAAGTHLGEYDAGTIAASGTVAALYAREVWGVGQHVDVSKQEATFGLNRLMLAQADAEGQVVGRTRSYVYGGIFPCRDGYVMLYPREDRQWRALVEIMSQPEMADDERFLNRAARIQNAGEVNSMISRWTETLGKDEIYSQVAPSGCPVGLYADSRDLHRSPQLQARRFFRAVVHPQAGELSYPIRPYRFSGMAEETPQPAPLLGQHNEEIFCGELGLLPLELANLQKAGVV
jgi:CoA:oxalate CoA-transferase